MPGPTLNIWSIFSLSWYNLPIYMELLVATVEFFAGGVNVEGGRRGGITKLSCQALQLLSWGCDKNTPFHQSENVKRVCHLRIRILHFLRWLIFLWNWNLSLSKGILWIRPLVEQQYKEILEKDFLGRWRLCFCSAWSKLY